MKVWVVVLGELTEHARENVDAVFATQEGANAHLHAVFEMERGKSYWWGTVTTAEQVGWCDEYEVGP